MKWNLKENSLFAILLRSPWWYSFAIAIALSLIASALLPSNLKLGGALGSFPFVVLGFIALRRQLRLPKAAAVEATLQHLQTLDWSRLAPQLRHALTQQGYHVEASENPAADFALVQGGRVSLLLARRFKSAQTGVEPLQALREAADQAGAQQIVMIALGGLSQKAQRYAQQHKLQIWDAKDLAAFGLGPG